MRLNLFLPHPMAGAETIPSGPARRFLARLGPTWAASPVRRAIQTACFLLFVVVFFYVCWPWEVRPTGEVTAGWPSNYADDLARREFLPAETFLALDPLVSISTALAAKSWVWSLPWASIMLAVCLLIPRGFCGFVCPLGTLIDLFDWLIGNRVKRLKLNRPGWWAHLRFYLLAAVLVASPCGVLLSGFVAAIPVLTRGAAYLLGLPALGISRGWESVPPMHAGHYVSIVLFVAILAFGVLSPRFWCRYVCPTGAAFSAAAALRLTDRKVESSCVGCGQCKRICPFDAIRDDSTTRPLNCTFCQTCGGVCPVQAIQFVDRWDTRNLKEPGKPPVQETPLSRRGFLVGVAGGGAAALGVSQVLGAGRLPCPVRPPGSIPERLFLQTCVRCGACVQACPSRVLQPMAFQQGLEGLWTPVANADWSGCEPSCNICGHVCPTGAVRALRLDEKRAARMGLAVVDRQACLPHAGRQECQFCAEQCMAAGYQAIEFERVNVELDESGAPVEDSGFLAPVVRADRCVGCGLCQTRCFSINAKEKGLLRRSAIEVAAGEGKDDRLATGSYIVLREEERRKEEERLRKAQEQGGGAYLPDFIE